MGYPDTGGSEEMEQRVVAVVRNGGRLLVVGWKGSNHSEETRRLEREGVVEFTELVPDKVGSNIHVLFTKFTGHASHSKMKSVAGKENVEARALTMGKIRALLSAAGRAADQLAPKTTHAKITPTIEIVEVGVRPVVDADVINVEVISPAPKPEPEPTKTEEVMPQQTASPAVVPSIQLPTATEVSPNILAFARDFMAAIGNNPEGVLGMKNTTAMIRKHFGEEANARTIPGDLLIGMTSEGKSKTGWYKPSRHLLELITRPQTTVEDLAKQAGAGRLSAALLLVNKKPQISERIDEIKAELAVLEAQLSTIVELEKTFAGVDELMKG